MIRNKSLRLRGTAVSAAVIFSISSACLVGEIAAQSAVSAIAGSSSNPGASSPFLVAPAIPLGYAPSSVATGDLRQSGKLDLVTTDYNSGNITVFLGAGRGKFAAGVEYVAGPHPSAVVVADINGDGRPDVLVSNESEGTISVLLGNGDGTLRARQSYTVGFSPSFIATGDFNGNGKVDVAVAGKSGSLLAILLNDGSGNLQKPVLRSLTNTPTALTVADFNGDGHADIALANADGTVSILLGQGAGQFRPLPDISVASGALSSIASGDFNKDGKIDLVVTQPGQKLVSVLLGKGDGTFASPASFAVGNEPVSALVADVNGDGVPALVVINKSSNTFSILGGNGDGTFKPSVDFVAGNAPLAAVAGDFYGDGHVDLAIINHASQTVSVPLGIGDGTFKAARNYAAGVQPVFIASGNLNGGKVPALVVANYCGSDPACGTASSVAVFLADDKGVYLLSSTYTVGAGAVSVALADVNGDKNLDIVALNRLDKTVSVLLGVGDGTFRQPLTIPLAGAPIAIAVRDLNHDGKPDLAVLEDCGSAKCSQAGSLETLLGGGDGSFQSASIYPVGYSPTSIAEGDVNGDKNFDILVANRCGKDASCQSAGTATVLIGDGKGKFTSGKDIALGNSPTSIALGNLTGAVLDLVVSRSADNTVAVMHGNGDGTFSAGVPYAVGNNPGSLVVADFNGDGKADVGVANVNDSTVSLLLGNGDGTLQSATAFAVGSGPASLTAVGSTSTRHASLATANGYGSSSTGSSSGSASASSRTSLAAPLASSGSSTPGTEISVLANLGTDPPLNNFVVSSLPATSNVNDSVALTATLTGDNTDPAPTGMVTFESNGTALSDCTNVIITQGTLPTDNSTATCTTQMFLAGSDSLTAVYNGDTIYDTGVGATSPAVTQTVSALTPTLGLTASPSSSTNVNVLVTFTAQLSPVAFTPVVPSGKVNFTANGTTIAGCGAVAVNATGAATCATSSLVAGSDPITATYSGDTNFTVAAPATATQTVAALTPTLGLTAAPSSSTNVNVLVTFTAQLSPVAFTPVVPSGKVNFTANGTTITGCGAVAVNATGAATCATSSLVAGSDPITATYSGDTNFTVAAAATATQTVAALTPTLGLTALPSTSVGVGASVTFTAQLTGVALTPVKPSGTVTFTINGASSSDCPPVVVTTGGAATCTTSSLVSPADVISAAYSGDTNFTVAAPATITETVGKSAPQITVTSSLATPSVNQTVTFTATVKPASGTVLPTGSVTFTLTTGGTVLCNAITISSTTGIATCSHAFSAPASPGTVTATYSGDSNFSVVAAVTAASEVVSAAGTTTTLSSAPSPSAVNQQVTFTATVTPAFSGTTQPTGSVVFTDTTTSTTLCTETLNNGIVPVCNFTFATSGSNNVVATYTSGDANFTGSVSAADVQSVGSGAVSVVLTSLPSPSLVNQLVTFTATINTNSGSTVPQGTMTYTDTSNSTTLCTVTLAVSGNVPACTFAFATAGTHTISAAFTSSNSNFSNGTSNLLSQPVNATSTTTTLSSLPASSGVNQSVAFTAVVTPGTTGTAKPTGTVVFTDTTTSTVLCSKTLSAGVVPVCNFTFTSSGSNSVVATYTSGDSNFTGSVSAPDVQAVGVTSTTTSIVSSLPSSAVNQTVNFTATIAPSVTGTTNPGGHVVFTYTVNGGGPVTLCASVAVSTTGGITTAVCAGAFSANGNYTVTAAYSGDANFGSSSASLLQPVGLTPTTTKVVASSPTTTVNQSVTFTATVTPTITGSTNPTGTVAFAYTLGGGLPVTLCAASGVTQATGIATCKVTLPASGSYTVTATYSGDTNFGSSSVTAAQTVNTTATTTTVIASPSTSTVNQAVTFTATITPAVIPFSGSTNPSGTVNFTYTLGGGAAVTLCSSVAVSTVAEVTTAACTAPLPTAGSYSVTVVYSGDANFITSSNTAVQAVGSTPTTTAVVGAPSPSSVNQAVTFTATVTPTITGSTNPTGSVAFSYSLGGAASVTICASSTVSTLGTITTATCTATLPAQGTYTITAAYSGDSNFKPAPGSVTQIVAGTGTTTAVVSAPSPSSVNQPVTFTATITPSVLGATSPTGVVAFTYILNGGSPVTLCASAVVSTVAKITTATCTAPLPAVGGYTVTAAYSGDANFGASSNIVVQTVNPAALTLAVHSSQSPSLVNVPVSFTATLTLPFSATATPTSTVQFRDTLTGLTLCSNVPVVNLTATCTPALTREWTAATHPVTATYNGDLNFPATTSPVFSQVVDAGATTATAVSSLPISVATQTVTFTATVTPLQTGPVAPSGFFTFTSSGVWNPAATCQAAPVAPVTTGTGAGTATATCTAIFPALAQSQSITATYAGDPNFTGNSTTVAQTVQNFTIADSVTSVLNSTPTTGPVILTQGYSTATSSAAGTDPFNPTNVQLVVTSTGGFADTLNLGCVVTNASSAVVTDPSCAVAATEAGATGTALTYEVTASVSAPIGAYTVTLTAIDSANPSLVNGTPLTVSVVGVANVLSLAQGASGTETANFNTTTAPASAKLVSFACGIVWNLTAKTQLTASQIAGLTCTGPASVNVTGASTPAAITISTLGSTTALLRGSGAVSLAAFLGVPLFALLGWLGSRKSPRKNFFRFLGLILVLVGVSYASGCGGSFTSTSKSISNGIAPGTYLVQVVATDQNGNKYYAAVPLDISSN